MRNYSRRKRQWGKTNSVPTDTRPQTRAPTDTRPQTRTPTDMHQQTRTPTDMNQQTHAPTDVNQQTRTSVWLYSAVVVQNHERRSTPLV